MNLDPLGDYNRAQRKIEDLLDIEYKRLMQEYDNRMQEYDNRNAALKRNAQRVHASQINYGRSNSAIGKLSNSSGTANSSGTVGSVGTPTGAPATQAYEYLYKRQEELNLEWKCEACGKTRKDADISVHSYQYNTESSVHGDSIKLQRNIKFCNDNMDCFKRAKEMQFEDPPECDHSKNEGACTDEKAHPIFTATQTSPSPSSQGFNATNGYGFGGTIKLPSNFGKLTGLTRPNPDVS